MSAANLPGTARLCQPTTVDGATGFTGVDTVRVSSWRLAVQAIQGAPPSLPALARLFCAGQRVARHIQDKEEQSPQVPSYHNMVHTQEALWAGVTLWNALQEHRSHRSEPWLPAWEGHVLIATMLGHDLDHPGAQAGPASNAPLGQLEAKSAERVAALLADKGVDAPTIDRISGLIRETEPVLAVPEAVAHWEVEPTLEHLLPVLAAEADVLASLCPTLGPERGRRLAQERLQISHGADAPPVSSWSSRRRWLDRAPCVSPAMRWLGMPAWVDQERRVLDRWTAIWDTWPWEEARAAHAVTMAAQVDLRVAPPGPEPAVPSTLPRRG